MYARRVVLVVMAVLALAACSDNRSCGELADDAINGGSMETRAMSEHRYMMDCQHLGGIGS